MDEHAEMALPEPCACQGGEGCDGSFCKCVQPPDPWDCPWDEPYTDGSENEDSGR